MAASCINTVTEYVIVVWLWCISVFLLEFIETRSAKMEFPCSETGHGGFIIACILSIFRLESVKRGDKGSSDKRPARTVALSSDSNRGRAPQVRKFFQIDRTDSWLFVP